MAGVTGGRRVEYNMHMSVLNNKILSFNCRGEVVRNIAMSCILASGLHTQVLRISSTF